MKATRGERVFSIFNYIALTGVGLLALLPFVHIISKSLSSEIFVAAREVYLLPKGFNVNAYEYIFRNPLFITSLRNSLFITIVGTSISMLLTVISAYPLTKQDLPNKRMIELAYIFLLFFSGGIIPTYMMYEKLNLIDNIWVLLLPHAISPFNLILMRNFFESISPSIEESAKMDGAGHIRILFSIIVPLSKPALATIGLFYAVGYWNDFFNAVLYTTSRQLMPIQLYLRNLIIDNQEKMNMDLESLAAVSPESIRAATIIAAMIPILLVYPFLQKYFVKGVMIGAVKG